MFNTKTFTRNIALVGALTMILGSSAFAQDRNRSRTEDRGGDQRGFANRTVEGTVASVVHDRRGERVRLTNGMDLVVPNTITGMERGRRYGAATLEAGDLVRMEVYSREGDGRDAQVRSLQIVQRNGIYNNDRRLQGTVVSYDRRERTLVMQAENGRTVDVDLRAFADRNNSARNFRRGDRISVSGRMTRGLLIADDIRVAGNTRRN